MNKMMVLLLSGLFVYGGFETYLTNELLLDPGYNTSISLSATGSSPTIYKSVVETKVQWTRTFPNATYGEAVLSRLNPLDTAAEPAIP